MAFWVLRVNCKDQQDSWKSIRVKCIHILLVLLWEIGLVQWYNTLSETVVLWQLADYDQPIPPAAVQIWIIIRIPHTFQMATKELNYYLFPWTLLWLERGRWWTKPGSGKLYPSGRQLGHPILFWHPYHGNDLRIPFEDNSFSRD